MAKNLVIVESPAKAKTISKYLGKDYVVMSSFGHVRDLSKKKLGVDVDNGFAPVYEIDVDKKKVIADLKKESKKADIVWLASDEDREGEAIAWHLSEALELDSEKTKRIVFHEITKNAILKAIDEPRDIDFPLVQAQQARRVLDRLVGFELSPLLWKKVKPSLSAGRVQSVAVRLIVEKEKEVKDFKPEVYYKVSAIFQNGNSESIPAELSSRFKTEEEALTFVEACKSADFSVKSVDKKPASRKPAAPFTTSTLQQEASRKLGFSVSKTMMVAQQLYESGLITYMRTDSVNLSNLALGAASEFIKGNYGEEYAKTRKFTSKIKGAQEAHEAIRPTYLENEIVSGNQGQEKLYSLIWKRTIASQMSEAKLERTQINIEVSGQKYSFIAKGEVILFDGFLKVYMESTDDEEKENSSLLPAVKENEVLQYQKIEANEKYTKHSARFTEASLVKKLEELGIGRPSTYAPTISTILKREYVVKETREGKKISLCTLSLKEGNLERLQTEITSGTEKNKLFPTDVGGLVNEFLYKYFKDILDYSFTANVEIEFDKIADGQKEWNEMITKFYKTFRSTVEETANTAEKHSGARLLGVDPKSGKNVYARIGRYGSMIQIGETTDEEKPAFAGMKKEQSINDITYEEAMKLFEYPRLIGTYEDQDMMVAIGRFGPYVKHQSKFFSLKKEDDPATIDEARGIVIIEEKREADRKKLIKEFDEDKDIKVLNGRYGPYISHGKKNIKIPKTTKPEELSFEDCQKLIAESETKKPAKSRKARTKK